MPGVMHYPPMLDWAWPLAFCLLPLPWLVRRWLPAFPVIPGAALRVPFLDELIPDTLSAVRRVPRRGAGYWAVLAWIGLITALARPQWLGEPLEHLISGRDVMLVVDLSASMEERDFFLHNRQVDRLTALKEVARDFIDRRVGDRIGLILFGTQAYLQAPLTFDRATVRTFLDEAVIGLAGENTAIGDAIGLAVKRLREQPATSRVLILLTDGANTAGQISPLHAAELAARERLKIYTVGIGADEMIVRGFFGARKVNPSQDLDENALRTIAEKTGGRYFRARDTEAMQELFTLLDELEPIASGRQVFRPIEELFHWPLAFALICAMLALFTNTIQQD